MAAEQDLRKASCAVIIHALDGRRKTATTVRWSSELSLFLRTAQLENLNRLANTITLAMYKWYTAKKNASQVKLLRSVLLYWSSLELPGLASDLVSFLTDSRPPKTRSTIEVQNTTPKERPLSRESVRLLLETIGGLYARGQFDEQDHLLWRLMVSEGMRPGQLALLLVGDVMLTKTEAGTASVTMCIPYLKQTGTAARDFMVDHDLSSALSHVVAQHLELVERVLGRKPEPSTPLFCLLRASNSSGGYIANSSSVDIVHYIRKTALKITDAHPTDEDMKIFSRRLKHTKLTHLAQKGASVEVLAAAAFQTSTASVARYVNLTEESFEELESLMADSHDSMRSAFRGTIVDRSEATHPDPEHIIGLIGVDGDLGSCGADPCGMLVCAGCYGCDHFEAFRDGPHDAVERRIARDHNRSVSSGSNEAIATTAKQLAVVREVIRLIEIERAT